MEEHLNFEENYLVYQDIGTGNENKQISDNLSFICDDSIKVYGYFHDLLPFPNTIYYLIGKMLPPDNIKKSNAGIFQQLKFYGSSSRYKGIIDKEGNETIPRIYLDIQLFGYNDFVLLKTSNSKYGVSRLCGNMVCSPVYDYIYQFSEYVFAVETNRKVGFMNIKGEIVIPIEYDTLSCRNEQYYKFSNGKAKVVKCLDGDYYEYYIDHYGNQISMKSFIDIGNDYYSNDKMLDDYGNSLDAFEGDEMNMWNID